MEFAVCVWQHADCVDACVWQFASHPISFAVPRNENQKSLSGAVSAPLGASPPWPAPVRQLLLFCP